MKPTDSQSELWVWLCHGTHQLLTYISLGQGRQTIHSQIHEKNLLSDMKIKFQKIYNEFSVSVLSPTVPPSGEDGSESHAETPGSETSRESRSYQTFTNTALKVLGGLLMVLCISSSWVGTTQVVKRTFQSFSCPFFISWFSSNWNILFFPIYYSGHVVLTREKQTPIQKFRYSPQIIFVFL